MQKWEKMTSFVDGTQIVRWKRSTQKLSKDMKKSLKAITKWLRLCGMKVNDSNAEICKIGFVPLLIYYTLKLAYM